MECLKETDRKRYERMNNEGDGRKRWLDRYERRRCRRNIFNADCNAELGFEV